MTIPERQTVVLFPDGNQEEKEYSPTRKNYLLPPSHRLNLSLNYTRQKRNGEALWSLGVYNAYNNMNPNFVFTDFSEEFDQYSGETTARKVELTKITILPIIPSISYTYKF